MADNLKQRLNDDVKSALKGGDKPRVAALRLLLAAVKQVEVDTRESLSDADVTALLSKQAKQRRESISQFEQAGRQDLVDQENFELGMIEQYLPEPLADGDIETLVRDAMAAVGATGIKDMGKVMARLKPQLQGRADMAAVGARVKKMLA